ncbi:hypothetical protein KMZ32_15500 [Phycicoccus sp. MAQZ13P-2]|uniref:hypothetical protein n=1 Tax=Phycicoccus mangrovi TaxID=2840470 RepID=UPI001BFFE69B|nr:hypothetical protein [Phycicoccus mangrovi]MBT9257029.1 hypothetical protein [Phycicoccus mangrovi]MBT9275481.1 hypothetical protein [Phycicoccus mangrovi]
MIAAARTRVAGEAAPLLAAVLAAVGVLGPALVPGAALVRDMVLLPGAVLGPRLLGLGHETARAVPSDAVAALASTVLGDLAAPSVLLLLLVGAGWGVSRLVPGPVVGRAAATVAAVWNPYVAERLAMGHWALLLGYAALPWVLAAAGAVAAGRGGGRPLLVALSVGALAGAVGWLLGVLALLAGVLCGPRGRAARCWLPAAGLVVALAVPWALPSLLRPVAPVSGQLGFAVFGPRSDLGDVPGGVVLGVLGGGGTWNASVVPDGRASGAGVVLALLALAVAVTGWVLRPPSARQDRVVLVAGALSLVTVLAGAALAHLPALAGLPGAGLLRDATRSLGPWAVVLAVGTGRAVGEASRRGLPRGASLLIVLLPVVLLPGAALGVGGRVATVQLPPAVAAVRAAVAAGPADEALVVLPWQPVRAYDWNGRRTSLTPWSRVLPVRVVAASQLVVTRPGGAVVVPGDDPLAADVGVALAATDPVPALRRLGVGWVLVDAGASPSWLPAGRDLGSGVSLVRLEGAAAGAADRHDPPTSVVLVGDALAVLAGLVLLATTGRRRERRDSAVTLQ